MFCAPGTGKSVLVREYPELFIDCDTIIEELMGESVNTLHTQPELWEYAKNQILPIWKRVHPTKILLTGKTRFMHESAIVVLNSSAEEMQYNCSCANRSNPITDWDFDAKHQSYLDAIINYKGLVHKTQRYLAGVIAMSVIRNWYHNSTCKKEYISQRYYCYHTNTWFKSSYITKEMYREYIQCI